ncbi:amino acid-binding protein [Bailinhaonella thermotolerans]|uniref:Amino acid-binding protein n=1 Tax=Bailinhaonella thermotolerans TaxID=1070861 RepID=A0A3A4B2N1_9ACTN|nr:amino acid-binding protein [Bailinhaonella thermotolerans]
MLLRLRVSMPDRPGTLGHVARVLGVLGADILQVTVLERETGRAVDDFTVSLPSASIVAGRDPGADVAERIGALPGVRVEGSWVAREAPGALPDYDLFAHVAAEPQRALPALVDAVPHLVSADWAVAVSGDGAVAHRSWQAPDEPVLPDSSLPRPQLHSRGGVHYMCVPLEEARVIAARESGPSFHPAELERLSRIADLVAVMAPAPARI